jgi:RHS repeat-associated protein
VDGVPYTWDANGNLLSDGVYTYTYSHADRLISVSGQSSVVSFGYNGLGDRLQQTVDGVTTNYAIDVAGGLTQVLSDGTNSYLYGVGRIGEEQPGGWLFHHGDALGSVRQLTDETGEVKLARRYDPYGNNLSRVGDASSVFQFTGETRDSYIKLIYLRSREYSPYLNQFIQVDQIMPNLYLKGLGSLQLRQSVNT